MRHPGPPSRHRPRHRLRALSLLLGLALPLAAPSGSAWAQAGTEPPRRVYSVPAGSLEESLNAFARQAGITLSFDPALVQGKQAAALAGPRGVAEGLAALLAGHRLEAVRTEGGAYTVRALPPRAAGESALATVTVTASAEREQAAGPVIGYIARRGGTATKTDTALAETPQSISVVGNDEIEDKGLTTLAEALMQTPGVSVNPFGFDARAPDWIVLRGFDGWYTSSYRDGLIQNVGITFLGVQTELYGLERIEVLRGPSSVLFGKGDAGGVVNRVSKLPSASAPRELMLQLGSYGRQELAADLGGTLGAAGELQWRLVGVGLDTGTQDQYPDGQRMTQRRQYLAPSLRWQPSAATSFTLQAESLRDNASDDVQFVTGADGQPTRVKEGDPRYSRIKTNSDAIGYQLEHLLDSGWAVRQKLRFARRTMDKHHILSWFDEDPTSLQRQARHDVETVRDTALDTSVQGTVTRGALEHRLLFGLDWTRSRADWRRWADMAPPLDMNRPVYGIAIPEPTTQVADTQLSSTQLGIYAQDQLRLSPRWLLTLGARHDHVKTENDDRFNASRTTQTDNAFTSRVGLSYAAGGGWTPYLSHATSFVPNVGVDATGKTFDPSKARQLELGAKYYPEGRPVSFTAAVFDLEKTGVVTYDGATFEARQIGKVRSRGIELETKAELTKQLRATASFSTLQMTVLESANSAEVGHMPILTPRRTAALWLDYALGIAAPGWSLGAGLRHVGRRWNDEANTSDEAAYTLVDAAVRYERGPWRFAANVSNLFDHAYYSGRAYGSYYRGAERNVLLTARYRF